MNISSAFGHTRDALQHAQRTAHLGAVYMLHERSGGSSYAARPELSRTIASIEQAREGVQRLMTFDFADRRAPVMQRLRAAEQLVAEPVTTGLRLIVAREPASWTLDDLHTVRDAQRRAGDAHAQVNAARHLVFQPR
jgi:hypothetical protein